MNKTTNLGLALYDIDDKFAITASEDSLNHNMELIDDAISNSVGKKTPDGGEIFNDYENNKALSPNSTAVGEACIAGSKGFVITNINSDTQLELETTAGLEVGYVCSIYAYYGTTEPYKSTANWDFYSTIVSIDSETAVTFDRLPANIKYVAPSETAKTEYIWVPEHPEAGYYELGVSAYVEGTNNKASMLGAHAEGSDNISGGKYSHTEGRDNIAGYASHAEGANNKATGTYAHAEGCGTESLEQYTHTEGFGTKATKAMAHAEGCSSQANGNYAHAEGYTTKANGMSSHAEGHETLAGSSYAHAEGYKSQAIGEGAHAEGVYVTAPVIASGKGAHAEGIGLLNYQNKAEGDGSHIEGQGCYAKGAIAHAEGDRATAEGYASHAEGTSTIAKGAFSHAEGNGTIAKGEYSHAGGLKTVAGQHAQTVVGVFNNNKVTTLFEVGNGASKDELSNALEVYRDGTAKLPSILNNNIGTDPNSIATKGYVDSIANNGNSGSDSNKMDYFGNVTIEEDETSGHMYVIDGDDGFALLQIGHGAGQFVVKTGNIILQPGTGGIYLPTMMSSDPLDYQYSPGSGIHGPDNIISFGTHNMAANKELDEILQILRGVKTPVWDYDAANKKYVDSIKAQLKAELKEELKAEILAELANS